MLYRNEFYSLRDIGYRRVEHLLLAWNPEDRSIGSGPRELERERVTRRYHGWKIGNESALKIIFDNFREIFFQQVDTFTRSIMNTTVGK